MRLSGQLPGLLSGSKFSVCLANLAQSSVSGLIQTLLGIEAGTEMAVCVDAPPGIDNWCHSGELLTEPSCVPDSGAQRLPFSFLDNLPVYNVEKRSASPCQP